MTAFEMLVEYSTQQNDDTLDRFPASVRRSDTPQLLPDRQMDSHSTAIAAERQHVRRATRVGNVIFWNQRLALATLPLWSRDESNGGTSYPVIPAQIEA